MGSSLSDFSPVRSSIKSVSAAEKIAKECGIIAIGKMLNRKPVVFLEGIKSCNLSLFNELDSEYRKGFTYAHLIRCVESITELKADMRYNSQRRDTEGRLFGTSFRGIVALKFNNTKISHWLAVDKGCIDERMGTMQGVQSVFPGFDGFGHTVIFREQQDVESLANTYSVRCEGPCEYCCRKEYCKPTGKRSSRRPRKVKM